MNKERLRLKLISCEVLARQAYYAAAFSPHVVDIVLIDKGLHREPDSLRNHLQEQIDAIQPGKYDALILGYGLCSNSIVGLSCPHTRIIVPRAHDCITLYLGSRERYAQEFRKNPGTYWYTADYIERGGTEGDAIPLGATADDADMATVYEEYVQKYGKDNADYLMEVMGAWKKHYSRAAYIEPKELRLPDYKEQVRGVAARRGWEFSLLAGSLLLIRDLVEGNWDDERFLVVPPGHSIVPMYDDRIITAAPQR